MTRYLLRKTARTIVSTKAHPPIRIISSTVPPSRHTRTYTERGKSEEYIHRELALSFFCAAGFPADFPRDPNRRTRTSHGCGDQWKWSAAATAAVKALPVVRSCGRHARARVLVRILRGRLMTYFCYVRRASSPSERLDVGLSSRPPTALRRAGRSVGPFTACAARCSFGLKNK